MLSKLPPRERQIVDILYERASCPSPTFAMRFPIN